MPDQKPKIKAKLPQKRADKPQSIEPALTFPRQVKIVGKHHPHHGKTGTATGDVATPPGLSEEMLLIKLDDGQSCYASPLDLSLMDDLKALARPSKRAAEAAARKKAKPRVTNGGSAGNELPLDLLQKPRDAEPLAESSRERKRREPEAICGAEGKRGGGPCRHPAGFRTDHPGTGKCWLHGGRSPAPTGRYSKIRRARLQELILEYQDDPDPLNLLSEVLLLRALLTEFIERFDEADTMLTRWNLSFEKGFQSAWQAWWRDQQAAMIEQDDDLTAETMLEMPDPMSFLPSKPLRMADITEVSGLIGQVGGMVDKIHKHAKGKTFDMATIDRLWTAMSAHLTQGMLEVIEDDALRQRLHTSVAEKWSTISLAELASRSAEQGEAEG
ncbi:hypothetical protein Dxin01_02754 [Deinococcus xinjiangensis]|uniref:Uncharacterized protein n=1 Tax=Deinococcus xinjiangensis TaxID=457454 RepID=A0ABP9VEM0_9DEIO